MAEKLRREFIELLEKDMEFRYIVAGYLGLSEILKRLDRLEEGQEKIWREIRDLRDEVGKLWENQNKLWENQNRLWENQSRLWEEVRNLIGGQNKLWEEVRNLGEGQNKLWEEVRALREGQNKLWEEVRSLREGQNRLWEEVKSLREGQNRLWEGQNKLWEEVKALRLEQERMRKYMISGFRELSRTLGVAFEDHVAAFLEVMLEEMGYVGARVGKKYFVYDGEVREVNLFCEEPLVIGEATVSIRSIDEAEREVMKIVEEKYNRKPLMTILSVARVTPELSEALKTLAEKHGVRLILGREIEEYLSL